MAAFDNPHSLLYSSGVLSHGTTRLSALKSRRGNCEHSHTRTTCDAMLLDGVVTTNVSTPDHVRLCCCWSEVSACRNCVCVRLLVFVVFVRSCMVLSWSRVHCTDSTFGFVPKTVLTGFLGRHGHTTAALRQTPASTPHHRCTVSSTVNWIAMLRQYRRCSCF